MREDYTIPADICRRCGLRAREPHRTADDCIAALRDLAGTLELRLAGARARRLRTARRQRLAPRRLLEPAPGDVGANQRVQRRM